MATARPQAFARPAVKLREAVAQKLGFNSADVTFTDGAVHSGNRSAPLAQAAVEGDLVVEDTIEFGDLGKNASAGDLRRPFRRGRCRRGDRGNPYSPHACRLRVRPHPQSENSAQPGDRRHDHGRRRRADGRTGGRPSAAASSSITTLPVTKSRSTRDIPHQDVIFLDETDPMSSPMKAKGVR